MRKIAVPVLSLSLLLSAISARAEVINIINRVDSMRCKAYYGGDDVDYFFIRPVLTNPGQPQHKFEFVHTWTTLVTRHTATYPVTAFTYDTNTKTYFVAMQTKAGTGKASFFQQGKGSFFTPEEKGAYPLDYCEIRGRWAR